MNTRTAALLVVALVAPGCRGRCCPSAPARTPVPTPSPSFFNDGQHGDVRGGRPENVFPTPATRTMFFDVRDLAGVPAADASLTAAPTWARLPELQALAPNTELQMRARVLVARGPTSELDAVRRRLDELRAATAPK